MKPSIICQKTKHLTQKYQELLLIDFYGSLPISTGNRKYLFTTIDVFSKFLVIFPVKTANAVAVIRRLFNEYFPLYGKPKVTKPVNNCTLLTVK